MIKTILKDAEDRMHKASEVVRQELAKIRTGKATTALLDAIKVEYYGSTMALNHIANVSVMDVHTLTIQPFDKGAAEADQQGHSDCQHRAESHQRRRHHSRAHSRPE